MQPLPKEDRSSNSQTVLEIHVDKSHYGGRSSRKVQFSQLLLRSVMSTVDAASLRRLVATFQLRLQKSQCLGNLEKSLAHYVRNGYGVITDPV